MSDPVTALHGATFNEGIAKVTEVPLQGMITLRGDLANAAIKQALAGMFPGDLPQAGQAHIEGEAGLAWMSPDEMLILCPYCEVSQILAALQETLADAHTLVVNVSDARASFRICGPHAREVLGKLCPVDLSMAGFTHGMFRRTRMAQVPAAFWLCGDDSLQVVCFRSQAQYVFDLLTVAAQSGSEVNLG